MKEEEEKNKGIASVEKRFSHIQFEEMYIHQVNCYIL